MPKEIGWSTEAYILAEVKKLLSRYSGGGSGGGGTVTSIATSGPITGGPISITGTIGITQATSLTDGYLSSTDWTTFNNKVSTTRTISTTAPLTGGGNLSTNRTLSIPKATSLQDGYLASTDWSSFNSKLSPFRGIYTQAPLIGGGNLEEDRTISIPAASVSSDGYLTSTDFNTFNNKVTYNGSTNYIPKLGAYNEVENSVMYESSGYIGINNVSPSFNLDIIGSLHTDGEVFLSSNGSGVHVGTSTPQGYGFYVNGNTAMNGDLTVYENTGTLPIATFYSTVTNGIGVKIIGDFTTTDEVFTIFQNVANSNIFQVTAYGGVNTYGFYNVSGGPYIGLGETGSLSTPSAGLILYANSNTPSGLPGLVLTNYGGETIHLYQQNSGVITPATLTSNTGTTLTDTDTFDGYTIAQVVGALRSWGLLQ